MAPAPQPEKERADLGGVWQATRYRAKLYGQNRANGLEPDAEATVG